MLSSKDQLVGGCFSVSGRTFCRERRLEWTRTDDNIVCLTFGFLPCRDHGGGVAGQCGPSSGCMSRLNKNSVSWSGVSGTE
ncbi:hypothetical protein JTE90_021017 [Oedothorax gibbosus]|uniref:Uncharacterized protein n=1 Tax=Oedothorax gibbosus TaxID=931172 RepID=A0AAV6TFU5_9ARAC|nr:hypothetical protein JTE90_021017 [Oedothorax gibbosus]